MAILTLRYNGWAQVPAETKLRVFLVTHCMGNQMSFLAYGIHTMWIRVGCHNGYKVEELKPLPKRPQPKSPIGKQLVMKLAPTGKASRIVNPTLPAPTPKRRAPMLTIKKVPHTPTGFDARYRDNKAVIAQLGIKKGAHLVMLSNALGLVALGAGAPRPTHLAVRDGYMAFAYPEYGDKGSPKMFYTNKGIRLIKEYLHHIPK